MARWKWKHVVKQNLRLTKTTSCFTTPTNYYYYYYYYYYYFKEAYEKRQAGIQNYKWAQVLGI